MKSNVFVKKYFLCSTHRSWFCFLRLFQYTVCRQLLFSMRPITFPLRSDNFCFFRLIACKLRSDVQFLFFTVILITCIARGDVQILLFPPLVVPWDFFLTFFFFLFMVFLLHCFAKATQRQFDGFKVSWDNLLIYGCTQRASLNGPLTSKKNISGDLTTSETHIKLHCVRIYLSFPL